MDIVAQVFDWKISRTELDFEENLIRKQYPDAGENEIQSYAYSQLKNSYLLMQEAINHGIGYSEDEFDEAMLDMIDIIEALGMSVLINKNGRAEQIDRIVQRDLLSRKYIDSINENSVEISEEKLKQFYYENIDFFCKETEVRASHILLKGNDQETLNRITEIRNSIKSPDDFTLQCQCSSECPSGIRFGDLGYFPRGRMIPEIEKNAFTLDINEISQPFKTKYGYHILLVTDKRDKSAIPFEEIKDCLKTSLIEIESEVKLTRLLSDLNCRCKESITIFENAFE
jgi:parvulin-like peptidyl-prolyl isomerase